MALRLIIALECALETPVTIFGIPMYRLCDVAETIERCDENFRRMDTKSRCSI